MSEDFSALLLHRVWGSVDSVDIYRLGADCLDAVPYVSAAQALRVGVRSLRAGMYTAWLATKLCATPMQKKPDATFLRVLQSLPP